MDKMSLVVKKTALHDKAVFTKYANMAKAGPIGDETLISKVSGKLEVQINGEPVGYIEGMKADDLPAFYKLTITGVGDKPNTLVAELVIPDEQEAKPASGLDAYKDAIQQAAQASGLTVEGVEARVRYMISLRVFPRIIKTILSRYRNWGDRKICEPPTLYVDTEPDAPACDTIVNRALVRILSGGAVIFEGPKSTGKNTLIESIAYMFACPYSRFTANERALPEDIFGNRSTDNSAMDALTNELAEDALRYRSGDLEFFEQAAEYDRLKALASSVHIVFEPSIFVKWAMNGGVLNWDEINAANANLLQQALNSAADKERALVVPGYGYVKLHPDCILLAGMNPGYDGMNELNAATSSRFAHIQLPYPESIINALKANFTNNTLDNKYFVECNNMYRKFKVAVEAGKISDTCLNIRGIVGAMEGVANFPEATTLRSQIMICVVGGCPKEEWAQLEMIVMDSISL